MGRITETVKVLIIINVIFFLGSLMIGDVAYRLFSLYYFEHPNFQIWQPITHMFMHSDKNFMHILFNMYGLWAFGSPLEMRWGRKKFLFFYFSAGFGAALIHTLVNYYQVHSVYDSLLAGGWSQNDIMNFVISGEGGSRSILDSVSQETLNSLYNNFNTPAVGASGAIYGILVAFGLMFPNIELMLIFLPIPIKAKYFIPLIILGDLFFGITGSPFGIAHWAHIGGAIFGFIMAYYWKKNSFDSHRWN
ncbi:rhomboid family intramembrane serine protease [Marixanthomonas sp. SCSIO 43207]|uniref:rhomboid family intramembrane serine protease n=1 Tax=Marixanthomonas sp. SCSIO 43207 TaxID=2779360 RepID=UPI001CA7CE4C|nr:rhomboid family intramembrane serine protease [Marixanthomonas sp. SCSIO 43207]UAB81115.1 rhomboid family intramembrane serine protease [Marixanthomonas sp. SCSIO 43207]